MRQLQKSPELRAALGFILRKVAVKFHLERNRISPLTYCPLTGRSRGSLKRFTITRVRFRRIATTGFFSGLRKAS
jgi:ribosomal protein S14